MSRSQFAFIVGVLLVWFASGRRLGSLGRRCRRADRLGDRAGP